MKVWFDHWVKRPLPVRVYLVNDYLFHWHWVVGLQFGPWFFGAIKSTYVEGRDNERSASAMSTNAVRLSVDDAHRDTSR